jgi:hypothetical protein
MCEEPTRGPKMAADESTEQTRVWGVLYDQIRETLQQFGTENYLGDADYLIVDDNYGFYQHRIEIHKLHMLRPVVAKSLQTLLRQFPDWEIVIAVDMPGKEAAWPRMGLTIRSDEIADDLQRQYLPREFQNIHY